jgi:transcriptional regulator
MKAKRQPRNVPAEQALTARLSEFHARRIPGREYKLREIADAVGCTYQNIYNIEKAALLHARELFAAQLTTPTTTQRHEK